MNLRCLIILFAVVYVSCNDQSQLKITQRNKPTVILQPLQFSDTSTLSFLKDSIEKFYPVKIVISSSKEFPLHTYYKPRNRYRADSTIKWLKHIKPDSVRSIVGITSEDVSVNKGAHKDYGVMGLGYKPGSSCVISTFRLRKTATSQKHFQQRLFKVVVHEMGHNFGLQHCSNETCIMVDAEGQMKLDREKDLCQSCRAKLRIQ
ncbi:matrixin family metalloprotease [Lacibacter sp. H375]|uniref:matrixin family metalloprotease n=1 Tax=Lacibacter sp. H375 TaxID=3133424 RepID=UPI0030C1765E